MALAVSVLSNIAFAVSWYEINRERLNWRSTAIIQDTELLQQDQSLRATIELLQQCSDIYVNGK